MLRTQKSDRSPPLDSEELKEGLRSRAKSLGFEVCGIAPVDAPLRRDFYLKWIAEGKQADMEWMHRNNNRRLHPTNVLPGARSIICVGLNYYQPQPNRRGRIAKYALGEDYHDLMIQRLKALCRWLQQKGGINKPYVDTGPVLEKSIAVQAGLGWQAKSTMLLNSTFGTWLLLGEIFTTLEIPPDRPQNDHCGKCTACIDACPTGAITAPYQLDPRKCISYLTIEHKGSIPYPYRAAIGDRVFGCDDCLDVCPWNRWARITQEAKLQSRHYPDLREMLAWGDGEFRRFFRKTPVMRLGRVRWIRNVCIVLGNIGTNADLAALQSCAQDPEPLIAEHATWAIGRIEDKDHQSEPLRAAKSSTP